MVRYEETNHTCIYGHIVFFVYLPVTRKKILWTMGPRQSPCDPSPIANMCREKIKHTTAEAVRTARLNRLRLPLPSHKVGLLNQSSAARNLQFGRVPPAASQAPLVPSHPQGPHRRVKFLCPKTLDACHGDGDGHVRALSATSHGPSTHLTHGHSTRRRSTAGGRCGDASSACNAVGGARRPRSWRAMEVDFGA
jgi:hypothetical protein